MTPTTSALATTIADDDERSKALLQALGFDRLSPGQRELALAVANRYSLDPMLKHFVMIEGRLYITRDGLLHVAHSSGVFDGIEATRPTKSEDGKHWESEATVYRKDMGRPFRYSGRYPVAGRNAQYGPEMAVKVAEVTTLRRAFDVAAPTVEEQWDDPDGGTETVDETKAPTSLAERVAIAAAAVAPADAEVIVEVTETAETEPETAPATEAALDQPEITEPVEGDAPSAPAETAPETPAIADAPTTDEPVTFGVVGRKPDRVHPHEDEPLSGPVAAVPPVYADGPTLKEFADLVADQDKALVKSIAKRLYPDAGKFADLTPPQLQAIVDELVNLTPVDEPETEQKPLGGGTLVLCGEESPYTPGATCTQEAGHGDKVPHRAGIREQW